MKQIQALTDELARSGAVKEELIGELARIQTQLEQRRSQLAFRKRRSLASSGFFVAGRRV